MEYQIKKLTDKQIDKLILESKFPMNSLSIFIPYSYALKLVDLNWSDILFAIENGYFTHQSAIEHAIAEIEKNENYSQAIFDLACLFPTQTIQVESIYPYIKELANLTCEQLKRQSKNKIMYVLLSWVFEHRENYSDPFKVVEIIYDDFGFPETISNFVRYMPSNQPNLGTVELNKERLYRNWETYLDKQVVYWKK